MNTICKLRPLSMQTHITNNVYYVSNDMQSYALSNRTTWLGLHAPSDIDAQTQYLALVRGIDAAKTALSLSIDYGIERREINATTGQYHDHVVILCGIVNKVASMKRAHGVGYLISCLAREEEQAIRQTFGRSPMYRKVTA